MGRRMIGSLTAAAVLVLTTSAFAQVAPQGVAPAGYTSAVAQYDAAVGGGCCDAGCCDAGCCDAGCNSGCCDSGCCGSGCGGWFVDFEANFMRFNQAEGVGTSFGGTPFDHEFAPRITVGVVGADGLGLRVRYWEYDHVSNPDPGGIFVSTVDTYNLDIELFERIQVCCNTWVEWSAGLRYNEYYNDLDTDLTFFPEVPTAFEGWGGVFGLQVNRCVGSGNFYARARWAILQSDSEQIVTTNSPPVARNAVDLTKMQTEIGLGYEMSRCLNNGMVLVGRVGYEWQYWNSYGTYFQENPHVADVGFDGIVLGVGLYR